MYIYDTGNALQTPNIYLYIHIHVNTHIPVDVPYIFYCHSKSQTRLAAAPSPPPPKHTDTRKHRPPPLLTPPVSCIHTLPIPSVHAHMYVYDVCL